MRNGLDIAAWAAAVCVLASAAGVARAQSLPLFTPPPAANTTAWFDWYDALLRDRVEHVSFQRDQTRFVSRSSGHDANDGLTPASAWGSLERASQWINSPNPAGETREILLRRGDVWRETQGVTTDMPGVRIADYGDPAAARPYVTGFTSAFKGDDGGWMRLGDSPVFARVVVEAVSWVREDGDADLDRPLRRMSTLEGVLSEQGSWWWDERWGLLFVHPRDADDPAVSRKLYEVAHTTWRGFSVAGDGSLVENIRADGFGLDPTRSVTQHEAFQSRAKDAAQVVFRNCESYYGSSHVISHNAGGGTGNGPYPNAGGVASFIDCVAGFARYNGSAGETIFNAHSAGGMGEIIFHNCVTARGTLPSEEFTGRRSIAAYGHTNGSTALGLVVVYGHRTPDHPHASTQPPRFNNVRGASTIEDARCFIVGGVFEGGEGAGQSNSGLFTAGHVHVNCHYRYRPAEIPNRSIQRRDVRGWWINSTLELDLENQSGSRFALYNTTSANNRPRLWNSAIVVRNLPQGMRFVIDYKGPGSSPFAEATRTVFSLDTGNGTMEVNLDPIDPDAVSGNAYWSATPAPRDADAVLLASPPPVGEQPHACSPLRLESPPAQALLQFDARGEPRSVDFIGPYQPARMVGDLDADWRVNASDLGLLLMSWGSTGGDADINGDGVVDASDLGRLLIAWGACP